MAFFGIIALWRWHETKMIFFLLLAFREFLLSYFIGTRKEATKEAGTKANLLAYVSTGLPLLYFNSSILPSKTIIVVSNLLMIIGFLLATLAAIELGTRMGVGPAKRGERCTTGVYRLTRHPMYVGYFIAELGAVILNPYNLVVFVPSMIGYYLRAQIENRVVNES